VLPVDIPLELVSAGTDLTIPVVRGGALRVMASWRGGGGRRVEDYRLEVLDRESAVVQALPTLRAESRALAPGMYSVRWRYKDAAGPEQPVTIETGRLQTVEIHLPD
jgi:hypothetical protein